jgi:hypothetical protein
LTVFDSYRPLYAIFKKMEFHCIKSKAEVLGFFADAKYFSGFTLKN